MDTSPRPSRHPVKTAALLLVTAAVVLAPEIAAAQTAHAMYTKALARERQLRDAANRPTLAQLRAAVRGYEGVVRRHPRSGYSDNALWQGGNLALLAFERFGQADDRRTAVRLLTRLKDQYPSSSLVPRAVETIARAASARPPASTAAASPPRASSQPAPASRTAGTPAAPAVRNTSVPESAVHAAEPRDAASAGEPAPSRPGVVTIRDIRSTPLPDGVRVSIEMDGESIYRSDRLEKPLRVFFDLQNTETAVSLQNATITFDDGILREIRFGRRANNTTRVVMELDEMESYSAFTLYNPFRLIVDFRRTGGGAALSSAGSLSRTPPPTVSAARREPAGDVADTPVPAVTREPVPLVSRPVGPALISPVPPAANANGQFSIARQLGLGVSRIVLDAGHGGHDPGARANGVNEAELVLDVTLRLRALLGKNPSFEVTLTRDKNVFVPLEERTAIANREQADLFLSIHANASRNVNARGIETYFLNFASNPDAAAVAARENSASGRTMHHLPEIVRAIALNNKIDESRDFAGMVQKAMVRRLSARHAAVRDLGVKQAPFVVLIGASMPSVLAEISFVTHKQEAALLKTPAYRQQIAESLYEGILRYQGSLKGVRAIAARE